MIEHPRPGRGKAESGKAGQAMFSFPFSAFRFPLPLWKPQSERVPASPPVRMPRAADAGARSANQRRPHRSGGANQRQTSQVWPGAAEGSHQTVRSAVDDGANQRRPQWVIGAQGVPMRCSPQDRIVTRSTRNTLDRAGRCCDVLRPHPTLPVAERAGYGPSSASTLDLVGCTSTVICAPTYNRDAHGRYSKNALEKEAPGTLMIQRPSTRPGTRGFKGLVEPNP